MPGHISVNKMGGNAKDIVTIKGLLAKGLTVKQISSRMCINAGFIEKYAPAKPKKKTSTAKKKATKKVEVKDESGSNMQ